MDIKKEENRHVLILILKYKNHGYISWFSNASVTESRGSTFLIDLV